MRYTQIYKNALPNYKNNVCWFWKMNNSGLSKYTNSALGGSNNRVAMFKEDSYRIVNNVCIVSLGTLTASLKDLNQITYIIDYETDGSYYMCYYVRNFEIKNGNAYFYLEIDYWGSYASKAGFYNMHVTRCNRNIGHGYLDNVQLTKFKDATDFKYIPLDGITTGVEGVNLYAESDVTAVFIASVVVSQSNDGTEKVTQTIAFGVSLDKIRQAMQSTNTPLSAYNGVELAQAFVAGISSINTTLSWATNKVNVLRMFLMPSIFVNVKDTGYTFNSKTRYTGANVVSLACGYVGNTAVKNTFNVDFEGLDPNYKYFVGTYAGGLELNFATEKEVIYYNVVVTSTDIKVEVGQGARVMDITKYFECAVNGSATIADGMDKTKWWIEYLSGVISKAVQMGTAIYTQNYIGALGAGTGLIGTMSQYNMVKVEADGITGSGDASTSYTWYLLPSMYSRGLLNCPLYITAYRSTTDEATHANMDGANFDVYDIDFITINDQPLLGDALQTNTYIKATAQIIGIPLNARDAIADKLANGIYYAYAE